MALVPSQEPPDALQAEYSGSSAKTLTLEQTTDDQPDEIIPDVDSTLIQSIPDGTGCGGAVWNDHPEATDFPDVRAGPLMILFSGCTGRTIMTKRGSTHLFVDWTPT